ncbi:MAG: hypothetical protein QNJ09_12510 [Paracoccaceae bacterium]|nr:hypothetical protein [Paracoccaceae bacterium]
MYLTLGKQKAYATKHAAARSVQSFNHDGLELARRRKHSRFYPLPQILQFALAYISFKVFLYFQMGAGSYGGKMTQLAEGSLLERVAAKVMTLDPLSLWVIDFVRYGLW